MKPPWQQSPATQHCFSLQQAEKGKMEANILDSSIYHIRRPFLSSRIFKVATSFWKCLTN